jgi:hypothetical protein
MMSNAAWELTHNEPQLRGHAQILESPVTLTGLNGAEPRVGKNQIVISAYDGATERVLLQTGI